MLGRRNILILVMAAAMTVGAHSNLGRAEDFGEGARRFVESMAQNAIRELTVKDISRPQRAQRFRRMMGEYFAVKTIARWVMGRHWRQANADQRRTYLKLYEDLMVEIYADRFERYAGETLDVTRAEVMDGRDAIVHSTLARPGTGELIRVAWRVRARGGAFKVIDIMVEGVSMGQAQRSEFASAIKRSGGSVETFLDELGNRLHALR